MKQINVLRAALLVTVILVSIDAVAQKVEEIKAKFPGHEAVMLNVSAQYRISMKNGEPYIES